MSESLSRLRLPLLLLSLVLLVGASKLDSLRPVEGQIVALVIPVVAVFSGASPFHEAERGLQRAVFALALLVLVLAEFGSYRVVFDDDFLAPSAWTQIALAASFALAVVFEVLGARRGLRARLSAWFGLAIVFALYFPSHAAPKNLFGSVIAAFMVALFLGGGVGLFLGEFAVRRARN